MADLESIKNTLDSKAESLKENQSCKREGCDGVIVDFKCDTCGKSPLGGARPGAGFPKGQKKKKTLEAMRVKEALNQRIMNAVDKLFNAQLDLAVGEKVLMVVRTEGEGKNRRRWTEVVTDHEVIKEYIDWNDGDGDSPSDDENYYYMTTKGANNMAIDSLINRALGKVPDKLEVEGGFFNQSNLVIKVVGEDIDDGDLDTGDGGEPGTDSTESEQTPTPSP